MKTKGLVKKETPEPWVWGVEQNANYCYRSTPNSRLCRPYTAFWAPYRYSRKRVRGCPLSDTKEHRRVIKWTITGKFDNYLYDHKFVVKTNNNFLTYVLITAKLDATGHGWLAELSTYDFSIDYRAGKQNIDADRLSRLPNQTIVSLTWIRKIAKLKYSFVIDCTPFGVVETIHESVQNADEFVCSFSINKRVVGPLDDNSIEDRVLNSIDIQRE